jgi:hypothetical protein
MSALCRGIASNTGEEVVLEVADEPAYTSLTFLWV